MSIRWQFNRLPLRHKIETICAIPFIIAPIIMWMYFIGWFVVVEYDMHTRYTYPADVCVTTSHGGYVCGKPY